LKDVRSNQEGTFSNDISICNEGGKKGY